MIRHIRTIFESHEKNYYKLARFGNGFCSNYIEYESNGDKDKRYQLKNTLIRLDHI